MNIPSNLNDLINEISLYETPREKFAFLIELGDELDSIPLSDKTENNLLPGCASKAWILIDNKDGKIFIKGDAQAQISKGIIAFLSLGLSGLSPKEILDISPKVLEESGVITSLSPSRSNGALSAIKIIRDFCTSYA